MPQMVIFFFAPFGILFGAAIFLAFGLLWSPFAALICALIAHIRGLSVRRYARAGAVYSALFFLPWVYLVARMFGKSVPKQVVAAVYIILYGGVWLCGTAGLAVLGFLISSTAQGISGISAVVAFVVSIALCIASVRQFSRRRACLRDNPAVSQDDILPDRAYIMPFAHTLGWLIIYLVAAAI